MFIESVSFENYRNLKNFEFLPSKGINVIYGDNAQGKTNLIESMWLFTGGRSFRGAKDKELLRFGEQQAKVKARFHAQGREQEIEIVIRNNKRKAFLNGVPKEYLSQIIGIFCAVVFSPNHLTLVKNGPEERRNFIDSAICQIKPAYASALSKYRKILNERNALLKTIPKNPELTETLDIWNERLANEGSLIAVHRYNYLQQFSNIAAAFYHGISNGKEILHTAYHTGYGGESGMSRQELKSLLLQALERKQNDDIYLGYTSKGIHRDDMMIQINGKDAKSFGSQGQQRSAVLAMKLAEASLLGKAKGESPVILLDDVLSELDSARQDYLIHKLEGLQVFITCCHVDINAQNKVFIQDGEIFPEKENHNVPPSRQ